MSENEQRLLAILKGRSFRLAPPGEYFRLASGSPSPYYIDGKMATLSSEGAYLIGQVLYERTKDLNADAVGGLQVGAVPLATAAVMIYHQHGRPMEGFWVREEVKTHGTRKAIEGALPEGARVVIVDDVMTRGGSALKAVRAVRAVGCEVVMVLAIVDRLCGAGDLFRDHGIDHYEAVFTVRDFGVNDASSGK